MVVVVVVVAAAAVVVCSVRCIEDVTACHNWDLQVSNAELSARLHRAMGATVKMVSKLHATFTALNAREGTTALARTKRWRLHMEAVACCC